MARRRLKLFLYVLGAAVVLIGVTAAILWKLADTPPAWARPHPVTAAETQHADQRLLDAVNWTADAQRRQTMPTADAAKLPPLKPLQISFSQDDLNAFFDQCSSQFGWLGGSVDTSDGDDTGPSAGIVLEGDRLILAVTPANGGSVLSVQFRPKLKDGKLLVPVVRVQKGSLPVPRSLWRAWRDGMVGQLRKQLPPAAKHAALSRDGSANNALIQAQTLHLLMDVLENRPSDPIMFFPYMQDFHRHFLPVRLTQLTIADHAISLSAQPLTSAESAELLKRIRGDDQEKK